MAEFLPAELIPQDLAEKNISLFSGKFLPFLKQVQASGDEVSSEKARPGEYVIIRDGNVTSLSKQLDIIPICSRPKAFNYNTMESNFNPDSDRFKEMIAKAAEGGMNGYVAGMEWLVFVPKTNCLATFHCASKTLRKIVRTLEAFKNTPCTLSAKPIETPTYKWWGTDVSASSIPIPPAPEDVKEQIERFKNPPAPTVAPAKPAPDKEQDR